MKVTPEMFENFLYHDDTGFLIKYHFKQGIDFNKLDKLYDMLEIIKSDWKDKNDVPKNIIYHIIGIIPALYTDLPLYTDNPNFEEYKELIYKLDTAIMMCLNPDNEDIHFETPLKEL